MNEVTAVSEAAYVNRLALNGMPYSSVEAPKDFFNGRQIRQRLMLILHALRATSMPVFIQAHSGMGKSTLVQQLQWDTEGDIRFIKVTSASSVQSVVHELLEGSSFSVSGESISISDESISIDEASLAAFLLQLRKRNSMLPVLIVDDVETIASEVLEAIALWLSWGQEGNGLVQAVFTGKTKKPIDGLSVQQIDLPVLTGDEVNVYLLYRLRAVGYEAEESPFSDEVVMDIAERSGGIPAEVNALAHQFLLTGKLAIDKSNSKSSWLVWVPVLILALIIGFVIVNKDLVMGWYDQIKSSTEQESISSADIPDNDTPTKVEAGKSESMVKVDKDDDAQRQELAKLLKQIPDDDDSTTVGNTENLEKSASTTNSTEMAKTETPTADTTDNSNNTDTANSGSGDEGVATVEQQDKSSSEQVPDEMVKPSTSSDDTNKDKTETSAATTANTKSGDVIDQNKVEGKTTAVVEPDKSSQAKQSADATASAPTKKAAATSSPKSKTNTASEGGALTVHNNAWVMAQSPKKYTYQMFGTWDRDKTAAFIKQYRLKGPISTITSMRNGKVWYSVTYGLYASKSSAMASRKQWTGAKTKIKPWLRSFASVQAQIMPPSKK